MKKLITIMILLSLFITCVNASYIIDTEVTDYSITYNFNPNIDKNAEIFFDNEKLNFWVENNLTMCGLTPSTCYRLTIQELPDTVQHLHTITLETTEEPFYAQYGIIGLFLLIIALITLSAKIEFTGYIAILLSTIGFLHIMKTNPEFYTALIFGILIIISVLTTSLKLNKE